MSDMPETNTAFLVLIAYVSIKIVDQLVIAGWRKAFGTKYVTEAECKALRDGCQAMLLITTANQGIHDLRRLMARHILRSENLTEQEKKDLEKMVV